MTTHQEAAEQLRVIRAMMERATIFRALSGEAALVGGAMSVAAGWMSEGKTGQAWGNIWLGGLAIVVLFATWQLTRLAQSHSRPLWSHGLKVALRGALPPLVAGGFVGLISLRSGARGSEVIAACFWIIHYGLALLAIREFAPKSMIWLGLAFLGTGLVALSATTFVQSMNPLLVRLGPSGLMAATFGGFHLLYGAAIVTTTRRDVAGA
jgi:hypothetical protein